MAAVKNSSIETVVALAARLADAGRARGFRMEPFGEIEGCPLFALTRRTPGPRPRLYLSAGMHGDEPAPPEALFELIRAGVFDDRATWFICPLLNPAGLARGVRENASGIDLNRDYKHLRSLEIQAHAAWLRRQPNFDLTLCVHEDWESTGYYLYELNPKGRPSLADAMIAAVAKVCPIDHSPVIDGREAHGGIIRPVGDPLTRETWPEAIYLHAHHTTLGYTLETPSSLPLPQRIAAHRAAIETAVAGLSL
ncbi:MAG TPA: M14 family metallocarboxypeptidase [Opitutaceae bacterium]|nr:M14 family metallocarboxypeptidase [Opitutaceae bacterium]